MQGSSFVTDLQKGRNFCGSSEGATTVTCKVNNPTSPSTLQPIGGYIGYTLNAGSSGATYTPTTPAQLQTQLQAATSGQKVWLDPDTTYDMTGLTTFIRAGVILASNRGEGGSLGALVKSDTLYKETLIVGTSTILGRPTIMGPMAVSDSSGDAVVTHSETVGNGTRTIASYSDNGDGTVAITFTGSNVFRTGQRILIWNGTGGESAYHGIHEITKADADGTIDITVAYTAVATPTANCNLTVTLVDDGTYQGEYGVESINGSQFYPIETSGFTREPYTSSVNGHFFASPDATFIALGDNVRINGIRFKGPDPTEGLGGEGAFDAGEDHITTAAAIYLSGNNCEVDNCEIFNWPKYGIQFFNDGEDHYLHHNHIHHCHRVGYGYGIWTTSSASLVFEDVPILEGSILQQNRHSYAGAGGASNQGSYIARYNIVLEHFNAASSMDSHSTGGGKWIHILDNIFAHKLGKGFDGFGSAPFNLVELKIDGNFCDHDTEADFYNHPADPGVYNVTLTDQTYGATNWHFDRPSCQISVDDDLHTSPSGNVNFSCVSTDPNDLPIDAYMWIYGESSFNTVWTTEPNFTLTGLTTGIHIVHVYARNSVGMMSRPSSTFVEVSSVADTSIKHNMVCWYEGASGFTDSHVFSNNLKADEGTIAYATGINGGANEAFSFDGLTNLIIDPDDAHTLHPNEDSITVSFGLHIDTLPLTASGFHGIFAMGAGSDNQAGYRLNYREVGGLGALQLSFSNGITWDPYASTALLEITTWYYIVIVFDVGTGNQTIYYYDTTDHSLSTATNSLDTTYKNAYGFSGLELASQHITGTDKRLKGRIDKFVIWRRALTAADAATLYNSGNVLDYGDLV